LKLDEPDAVSYLRAFMYRTAANLVQDRLKQRQRRSELRQLLIRGIRLLSPLISVAIFPNALLLIYRA